MENLKNTTLLQNDGTLLSVLQCNALASLVHFVVCYHAKIGPGRKVDRAVHFLPASSGLLLLNTFHLYLLSRYLFPASYLFNNEVLVSRTMENSTTSTVPSKEAVNVNLIEGVYLLISHRCPVPERLHYCQQKSN